MGVYINGLCKRSDGRWVIVETGEAFVEPNERRAVSRFGRWETEQTGQDIVELVVSTDLTSSPKFW